MPVGNFGRIDHVIVNGRLVVDLENTPERCLAARSGMHEGGAR
jgi:hypothetical protein